MRNSGYGPWTEMKGFTIPVQTAGEWNKAATEWFQHLNQQNLDLIGEHCSRKSNQLKQLTNIRKLEDVLHFQKECFNEDVRAMIECTQKWIHNSIDDMGRLTKICETSMRDSMGPFEHKIYEETERNKD